MIEPSSVRALSLTLAGALGCAAPQTSADSGGGSFGWATSSAPLRFELRDTNGRMIRTADYAGRVLLVDLWATWCRPCEMSMPFYASLERRLGRDGLSVLAVSVDEHDDDVAAFLRGRDLPFPVLRDPGGRVVGAFEIEIETMPTAVIVGRDGGIAHVHSGFVDEDRGRIEGLVRAALDKR